jgi:hypothetical protein
MRFRSELKGNQFYDSIMFVSGFCAHLAMSLHVDDTDLSFQTVTYARQVSVATTERGHEKDTPVCMGRHLRLCRDLSDAVE